MFVTKRKVCGRFAMTCKFVKKFVMAILVIHKRQHDVDRSSGSNCKQVTNGAEANYALHREEIAENEANEALLTSSLSYFDVGARRNEEHQYAAVNCIKTIDGSFYWDISMQQLPVDGDLIEVHDDNSFRNLLSADN